jgi:tetratricopeptide (TPR) repeat protein
MTTLTIAPIGTCRIHTPLRNGAGRYPIKLQLGRNYGFVHTSTEALQQARFMYGECEIPDNVQRLIFRPSNGAKAGRGTHKPADLYMVEVSSRKLLTIDGYPIQSNYMARYFSEFFADRDRTRMFWSQAVEEKLAERRGLLEQDPVFKSLPQEDRELLSRVVRRDLTEAEIGDEMAQIVKLLGKEKVVFVTHANAMTPDNAPIEQRQQLISIVSMSARSLGVPCYDPTPLMNEIGQADAMEDGGLDLTHYTELFSQRLCAEWYESYMRPRMSAYAPHAETAFLNVVPMKSGVQDSPAQGAVVRLTAEESAESIEKVWDSGQLLEASRLVRDVLRRYPGLPDHVLLLARIQGELGDHEGSIALLENDEGDSGSKAEQILMRDYFKLDRYETAYSLATGLLGDEKETPEIVRIAAISAGQLGNADAALANWKQLFRISSPEAPEAVEAADTVFSLLRASGDREATMRWVHEIRAKLPTFGRGFTMLWRDRLAAGDRAALRALAAESPDIEELDALDLVKEAAGRGFIVAASMLAASCGLAQSEQDNVRAWLFDQSSAWAAEGARALEEGRLRDAAERICAHRLIDPSALSGMRSQRALERALRISARAALMAGEHKEVMDFTDIALDANVEFPEFDAMRGRAADALGDKQAAMHHLKRAAAEKSATFATKLFFARVAFNGGWFGEAIDAYNDVLAHESADESAKDEANRQLGRLGRRSIRAVREMSSAGEHHAAWNLLERINQSWPEMPEIENERRRIRSALYSEARALDSSSASERLAIGEKILQLIPGDTFGLREAAVGAMRLHRFEQALPYWQSLKDRSDNPEQFDHYIQRCLVWIEKANRRKAA